MATPSCGLRQSPTAAIKIKILGKSYGSHKEALSELQRQYDKGAVWHKKLRPGLTTAGTAALYCKTCHKELSITNPHDVANKHKCNTAAVSIADMGPGQQPAGTEPTTDDQQERTVDSFYPTREQRDRAMGFLAMFFITTCTPFARIQNQWLSKCFGVFTTTLPSEKVLRTTMLDQAVETTKGIVKEKMVKTCGAFQLVTDGWKSKFCQSSSNLVNVITTIPTGGCVFHKVGSACGYSGKARLVGR